MKKTIFTLIVLCFAVNAMATDHEPEEGLTWKTFLGLNISKIRGDIDIDDTPAGTSAKAGLDVGIKSEFVLPNAHGTYLSLGVEWAQKGGKQKVFVENPQFDGELNIGKGYAGTHKINEHYISIPIHVGFRRNINSDWGVYGEAGPYLAVGVTGRNRFDADQEGSEAKNVEWKEKTFKKKTHDGHTSGGFQRFDTGIGFSVGTEYMNHYSLNFGWDWGLTDMLRGEYRDNFFDENEHSADKLKNFSFSLTLGYRF